MKPIEIHISKSCDQLIRNFCLNKCLSTKNSTQYVTSQHAKEQKTKLFSATCRSLPFTVTVRWHQQRCQGFCNVHERNFIRFDRKYKCTIDICSPAHHIELRNRSCIVTDQWLRLYLLFDTEKKRRRRKNLQVGCWAIRKTNCRKKMFVN